MSRVCGNRYLHTQFERVIAVFSEGNLTALMNTVVHLHSDLALPCLEDYLTGVLKHTKILGRGD